MLKALNIIHSSIHKIYEIHLVIYFSKFHFMFSRSKKQKASVEHKKRKCSRVESPPHRKEDEEMKESTSDTSSSYELSDSDSESSQTVFDSDIDFSVSDLKVNLVLVLNRRSHKRNVK